MTLGSFMNWGGAGRPPAPSIERYHSGPSSYWDHKSHGHGSSHKSSKGGGGSGAALSALTLLAFLFLINVMQQSLQENNSTAATASGTTALLLREGQQPGSVSSREKTEERIGSESGEIRSSVSPSGPKKSSNKGDTS